MNPLRPNVEETVAVDVEQLDFSAVIRTLASLDYDDLKLDALGEHFGFATSVTVEELAAAGVSNRTLFHLRRRLTLAASSGVRNRNLTPE